MGDSRAFLSLTREAPKKRAVSERVRDWSEVYLPMAPEKLRAQASRCMDCGVPFCHSGCPLGNLIPDWNDLVYRGRWQEALVALHATNNFPEFTGRLCPAPCEDACVLAINDKAVTIKTVEQRIIDHGFEEGWVVPEPPQNRTGKRVAIIGSGPAGLAAAQQLNRAGHWVKVFERDDRLGGLMRYGIPDFKMDKFVLDRRLKQLEDEGIVFCTGANVGGNVTVTELRRDFDAVLLCTGALAPRMLDLPGVELKGVHYAMDYLVPQNKRKAGDSLPVIDAKDKHVVIIGGGDTGADCYGTATRQGAASVTQFQIHPEPPVDMPELNPWWPQPAHILKNGPAHEEGGERAWGVHTTHFEDDGKGHVKALHAVQVERIERAEGGRRIVPVPGSETIYPADLVLVAIGYTGPERSPLTQFGVELDARGNVKVDEDYMSVNVPAVFAAGDSRRGQSLIVWAIAEGREAAHGVDQYLMGVSRLPRTSVK
ncbi:MAG: glutamate synthase subunit beta [Armatimonadetes bacterium]|jgi:glutamate synthase (NADPH/NADH) small chain|nr:glutamate synthase subunit beta [Armatimonadota bacterium]